MSVKSNEIKAGMIVFSGIIVLILFIMAITGSRFWYPKDEYYILMKFAGGLEPGVPVRYGGIKVGEVREVKIFEKDNSKIEAVLEVKRETPIKYDSEAFINSLGVMGEYYIEVTTGSDKSKILPPENFISFKEIPKMSDLYEDLRVIEKQTKTLLSNIDNVVQEVDFKKVSGILSNLDQNINLYSEDINNTMRNLSQASSKLGKLVENIDENFDKNSEDFSNAAKNLGGVLDKSINLVEDMMETLKSLNYTMLISSKNIDETMNNLYDVSRNLKDFSSTIRDRPWTIIRKSYEEERKK